MEPLKSDSIYHCREPQKWSASLETLINLRKTAWILWLLSNARRKSQSKNPLPRKRSVSGVWVMQHTSSL